MDYEKAYNEAIKRAKAIIEVAEKEEEVYKSAITIFPELRESEDEQIRKEFCKDIWTFIPNEKAHKYISWLAKQGETFTKKDVDDAYLKGISDTKNELEKQDKQQPAEWSEEDDSMICELIHYLNYRNEQGDFHADLIRDWVVSLKDRTQSVKMKELLRTEYEKGKNTCGVLYWHYMASGEWMNDKYNPLQKAFVVSGKSYIEVIEAALKYTLENLI